MSTDTKDSLRVIFPLEGDPRENPQNIAGYLLDAYDRMRGRKIPQGKALENKALSIVASVKVEGRLATADIQQAGAVELSKLKFWEKLGPEAKRTIRHGIREARKPGRTVFFSALMLSGDVNGTALVCIPEDAVMAGAAEMNGGSLEKDSRHGCVFDRMGYATPKLCDQAVMDALRIVTKQAPVLAKMAPRGMPYLCHVNAATHAEQFGGRPVRGYRVELSAFGFLELIDHSVIQVGDDFVDVTPYHGAQESMFVAADRDLPTISDSYIHPHAGRQYAQTKPCFLIPLTREGQTVALKDMGSCSAQVEEARLWDEGMLTRANTIVLRFPVQAGGGQP
jgi:hypothetical protein